MGLGTPVSASLDSMDSAYAYPKLPSQLGGTRTFIQQHTYEQHMSFIKYGPPVLGTLIGLMFYGIIYVLIRGSVAYIAGCIVIAVSVNMTYYHSRWSGSYKRLSNYYVYVSRCLRFVLWPSLKRYRQVMCRKVWLPNKPLSVFDSCYTSKIADFVTIMPNNRLPNLWSIRHG